MSRACFFALFVSALGFSQTVVPIDAQTREFLPDVNYHLFLEKKEILSQKCENQRATEIASVSYDSIVFEKLGYERKGFAKSELPKERAVFLTPMTFPLDEITLSRLQGDTLLGEKAKIYRRGSRPLLDHLSFALRIPNPYRAKKRVRSFRFFVGKAKYKTAYRLCFYRMPTERFPMYYLPIFGQAYQSEVLYLDPDNKGEIKIDLTGRGFELPEEGVLASVELVGYVDADGNTIVPDLDDRTMIELRFSTQADYFTRTADYYTKKESNDLLNINARVNFDFAILNFGKPRKSTLLAPAYYLEIDR